MEVRTGVRRLLGYCVHAIDYFEKYSSCCGGGES